MTPETKAFVEQCEARANKATPGPIDVHRIDQHDGTIAYQLQQAPAAPPACTDGTALVLTQFDDCDNPNARNDATFYANARTDLPEALRIIREQDAEIDGERNARLDADSRLDEVCDIIHAGEDVPAVDAAKLVTERLFDLWCAVKNRYSGNTLYGKDEAELTTEDLDMDVLDALGKCDRFFDDDAEI